MNDMNFKIPKLKELLSQTKTNRVILLAELNVYLEGLDAEERIAWALNNLPSTHIVSSSFGVQSAVMLHLMVNHLPEIPVVLTDTGYLFPETYRFIDQLTENLELNLKTFRAEFSPSWQEARYGKLWQKGLDGN